MKTAEDVQSFLTQMDRRADTGDPEDDAGDPDDLDTGDPNDDAGDPDDDAGDPDNLETAGPIGTAQIQTALSRFMQANSSKPPTRTQVQGLMQHAYVKGMQRRPRRPVAPPPPVRRPLAPKVQAFRNDAFSKYRRTYGETVTTKGYYYGTSEVVFSGVGNDKGAALVLQPTTVKFFHEAIDDSVFRLTAEDGSDGISHTVNPGETNLQYPGKNLYPRELFIITHVGIEFCGMRVLFDPATVKELGLDPQVTETLTGGGTLWDDGKVFLPGELINDFDGRCRLIDAMYPSGVLYFAWNKQQGGGSRDTQELLISTMQRIPVARMPLNETSGGANVLEMNEGYVWSLDQQTAAGRYGIFQARMRTHERVTFPVVPVDIGGKKLIPKRLSAILRMTVYGDAIRPKDDVIQTPEARARR